MLGKEQFEALISTRITNKLLSESTVSYITKCQQQNQNLAVLESFRHVGHLFINYIM